MNGARTEAESGICSHSLPNFMRPCATALVQRRFPLSKRVARMATQVSPSAPVRESAAGLAPQGIAPSGKVHWNFVAPELIEIGRAHV